MPQALPKRYKPFPCDGALAAVTSLDQAAFDAIGWSTSTEVLANPNNRFTSADAFAAFGVQEPAQWALMLGGFGIMGAAVRRRRPQITVAYA